VRARLSVLLPLVLMALGARPAAVPHLELLRSAPAANETVKAGQPRIQLWFNQAPAAGVSRVTLAKHGRDIPVSKTTIDAGDKSMYADPAAPLAPGSYTIRWRGAGDDGHVQSGVIAFVVVQK
jgi:methionine-rich copper-binding protein CopC